ncbi:hypothetical protein RJ639_035148 [Escallonia herrerae]|uniref:Uncharacterized protein n=1 Tax=Escallonia herrerae TaxID=1293975 RepID=A0AA88WTW0_9ASTE|nr:hypothetical protein RJ639_035148 [Escallonia herrerae]
MEEREDREENAGTINTISGGIAAGGSSGKARKAYAREVCVTSPPPNKKLKTVPAATITFFDDDSKDIKTPHDDPLVITIKAGNFDVKRVLIDNGSFAEILFHDAFKEMNIPTDRLRKMDTPLYGFSNHPVAAEVAVSTVLIREEDGVQKPIYYISKVLQDVETRYPKIDKIALALIISARRLRPYFQSHTIIVLTDQPLRKVLLSPEASGRLVNWSVELGEFDIEYKPRTTIKAQALADFIIECTLPEEPPQLVISAAPDPWNLYIDGSSALGSSGARLILISPEGFTIEYALRFGFQASNNEAEYEALLAGIRLALALNVDSLSVHSDSQLVVNHVLGDYDARDERMAQYLNLVKTSAVKFQNFTIRQIPRDQNTQADTLSRLTSAEEMDVRRPIYLEFLKDRSISSQTEVETIEQESCWMDMIVTYLSTGELPSERHKARNLRVKAARYALVEGTLYKKSFSLPYLRCLRLSESIYALQEVHEGICGQHLGGRTLAQKILRQGYYWPTMQRDAIEFTRRWDKCQKFAPISHTPVVPLTSIVSPIPFAVWGMDLLGPFPMASGQRRFVIVAIEYFTKWTEAESLATITSAKCEDFFWKNVVCRFGVPRALVVDNGKQFHNKNFRTFCTNLSIDLRFTSVAHPQSNGQTENMNQSILQGLKKKLDEAKGAWVDELPKVLWAYRTTPHSVTGETPFLLCYGTEAMLPVEIGVPTIRSLHFHEVNNEAGLRANLDLLDETQTQAHERSVVIKQRVSRYYNQRVRSKQF